MSIELSTARELLAAVALVMMVASAGVVAWAVVPRLAGRDLLLRALLVVLTVLTVPLGICLLLAMAGVMWLPTVLVAHVLVAVAVLWRFGKPAPWWPLLQGPTRRRRLVALVVGASAAYLTYGAYLSLTGERSRDFDTRDYHLTNLATWLRDGDLWGLPYAASGSVTATHPGNGELLGAWLALPTHGDELVYLVPLAFAALTILAMAVLVRELRPDERWAPAAGATAALAVLTTPIYFGQLDSLLTDLVAASGVVTAVALILVARRREGSAVITATAGVALGMARGTKYTGVVPAAVVTIAAVLWLGSVRRALWLVPGGVALAAPWLVRNIVVAGNPLFPQDLKVVDGSETPYDLLNTTMLHHLVEGNTDIVRSWARLGGRFVGPVLLLVALGIVLAAWRARRGPADRAPLILAAVTAAMCVGYLATPVTGGGPPGVEFIITSCFRYALVAVLLGAALGAAMVGRRAARPLLAVVILWNVARLLGEPIPGRSDVALYSRPVTLAFLLGVGVGVVVLVVRQPSRLVPTRLRVVAPAAAVVLTVLASAAAIHTNDRGRTQTSLEALVGSYGPTTPVVPVGVTDLRALLGPRLERPLVRVSRGGAAEEIPFADEAQLRRRILDDTSAPPPPPELARELDAALDATGAEVIAVADGSPLGYPDGWVPDEGWCFAGGDDDGTVFVRAALLPAGTPCTTADDVPDDEGEGA